MKKRMFLQRFPIISNMRTTEGRGVIKVTDLSPADYPAILDLLPEGSYHIYDYQFFYRSLQENVNNRVRVYVDQMTEFDNAA